MSHLTALWRTHWLAAGTGACMLLALLWLALAPVQVGSRERLLEIGAHVDDLPATITLTLGVQDVLLLRNVEHSAQRFGPVQLKAGQQFRVPFEQAGEFTIAAGAWPGGMLKVIVVEWPSPGWERIRWRVAAFSDTVRYLPKVARPPS